jgi:hypothetical protein
MTFMTENFFFPIPHFKTPKGFHHPAVTEGCGALPWETAQNIPHFPAKPGERSEYIGPWIRRKNPKLLSKEPRLDMALKMD